MTKVRKSKTINQVSKGAMLINDGQLGNTSYFIKRYYDENPNALYRDMWAFFKDRAPSMTIGNYKFYPVSIYDEYASYMDAATTSKTKRKTRLEMLEERIEKLEARLAPIPAKQDQPMSYNSRIFGR